MMTPQLTEQYGQVLRVSVAREILRLWAWAYAGARSNPKADRPTPPARLLLRKVLRESSIITASATTSRAGPRLQPSVANRRADFGLKAGLRCAEKTPAI